MPSFYRTLVVSLCRFLDPLYDNIGGVLPGTPDGHKTILSGSYDKTFVLKVSTDVLTQIQRQE